MRRQTLFLSVHYRVRDGAAAWYTGVLHRTVNAARTELGSSVRECAPVVHLNRRPPLSLGDGKAPRGPRPTGFSSISTADLFTNH